MPYGMLLIQEEQNLRQVLERKRDEFLDVYSFYLKSRMSWIRDEVRLKAYELHLVDPTFNFQI